MSQDYNEYLAINVLNEQQIVSYRSLSRALKVHSNLAKQMMYEFHRKQNAKKPSSVHATYLITGTRRRETTAQTNGVHSQDDDDTVMQSSPPLPSSSAQRPDESMDEPTIIRSIMLAKEEHFEQAKKRFDNISSIHIYSLEADGLSDVQILTDCNRKIAAEYTSEDPLKDWKQYGTIQNPNAKQRTRRTAPPPPAPIEKNAEAKMKPFANTAKAKEAETKAESKPASKEPTPQPEKKTVPKPAQTKRQNSDIFKSFAKGKTKAKQESQSSAEASPAPEPEDEAMGGFSDDDGGDDDDIAMTALEDEQPTSKAPPGKSKKEREAELEAMMNQEDEAMEDAVETHADEGAHAAPAAGPAVEASKPESPKEEEPNETVTVENGRRRGKRRIMKKKKVKDEEGYLVTIEEPAWESFSEDEPAPKKVKSLPSAASNTAGKPVAKKGGKPGQGNIMTFFSKK